jgi:hypothetical protein
MSEKPFPKLETPGFDARFPNCNQVIIHVKQRPKIVSRITLTFTNVRK